MRQKIRHQSNQISSADCTETVQHTGPKLGRPRKFEQGRRNATVRFSPKRYADLKKAADDNRRSVSEEVEYRIEELAATHHAILTSLENGTELMRQAIIEIKKLRMENEKLRDYLQRVLSKKVKRLKGP